MSSDVSLSTLNIVRWDTSKNPSAAADHKDSNWEKLADLLLTLPRVISGGKSYKLIPTPQLQVRVDRSPDGIGNSLLKTIIIILSVATVGIIPLIGYGIKKHLMKSPSDCFNKHNNVKVLFDEVRTRNQNECKDGGAAAIGLCVFSAIICIVCIWKNHINQGRQARTGTDRLDN